MTLTGTLVNGKTTNHSLALSDEEYTQIMAGGKLKKMVACSEFSGVITLSFKKNSAARHKEFIP